MKFQLDTDAECNVVPLKMYKEATGDILFKVMLSMDAIVDFGESKMLLAEYVLQLSCGDTGCTLCCNLADTKVRPLLGQKAFVGMKLIQVLDSDNARHPKTDGYAVFAVNISSIKPLAKSILEMKSPTVFADGVGKLEGENHIS